MEEPAQNRHCIQVAEVSQIKRYFPSKAILKLLKCLLAIPTQKEFACQMIIVQIKQLKHSDITNLMREITQKLIHIQVEKNKILQLSYLFRNLSRNSIFSQPQSHQRLTVCNSRANLMVEILFVW